MALLRIVNGASAGATFPVGAGSRRVGRTEGNDLCLPDGSVSSSHCVISLDPSGNLLVRDLGSTNGTFIEGQKVREALVQNGQRLRLGTLEMVFEGDGETATGSAPPMSIPAAVSAPLIGLNLPPPPVARIAPPAAGAVPPLASVRVARVDAHATSAPPMPPAPALTPFPVSPDDCHNHPGIPAVALCGKCGLKSCASCTKQQKVGRNFIHFCGSCGGQCKTLTEVKKTAAVNATRTRTFGSALQRAIGYPFRGNGIILLICGTLVFTVLDIMPKFGLFGLILHVTLWGYIFAFMQRIVVTSAAGENDPPEFPEVTDFWQDIVTPFFQNLVTQVVALAPGIATMIFVDPWVGGAVLLLGLFYYPMGLLGVLMSDSYSALNPVFVMSSIMKVFGQYVVTCFCFVFLMFMYVFLQGALYAAISIPFVPQFGFWFVFLIALMTGMRILGMLYYLNKQKLGWGL